MTAVEKLLVVKLYGRTILEARSGPATNVEPWAYSMAVMSNTIGSIFSLSADDRDELITAAFDSVELRVFRMVLRIENT